MPDTPTIDQAFIKQFEEEVKLDYQRMGSKLRNLVRHSDMVVGSQVRFQKIGAGTAQSKARHGDIPVLNLEHTNVDVTMTDAYAGEYIDRLDLLKTNIDERGAVSRSISAAMGRKTDANIVTALNADTTNKDSGAGSDEALTKARVIAAQEFFNENDVPMDDQRYLVVGPHQWSDLLGVEEFVNADYIGLEQLPFKGGLTAKRWLDFLIFPFSGLSFESSDNRLCHAWHKISVGLGVGSEFALEVNYVPVKAAWLVAGMESNGAVVIDANGHFTIACDE